MNSARTDLSDLSVRIEIRSSSADLKTLQVLLSSLEEALYGTVQSVKVARVELSLEHKAVLEKVLSSVNAKYLPFK